MKAYASVEGGHIVLATKAGGSSFDEMLLACKAVAGARFNKPSKKWRYPLSVETCYALREVWGDGLTVDSGLGEWFREAKRQRDEMVAMGSQADATLVRLPEVAPALASTLRPDQRVGAAWVAQGYRGGGMLCDQPGIGKTLVSLAGILEEGTEGPILVVCPKLSVRRVWYREIKRWTNLPVYAARGTRAQREKVIAAFQADTNKTKVLIVVAEMLRIKEEAQKDDPKKKKFAGYEYPELFAPWQWVVVDESHKLFGSLTITKGNLAGKGVERLPLTDTGRKLAVTGTPFGKGGRLTGMFGTLHWLWPDEYTSFWRWAETYFEVTDEKVYVRGGHGATQNTKKIGGLRRGSEGEFLASFGPRIMRRTKKEVLPWLPPKQFVEVLCEMTGEQLRQYKTMNDEGEVITKGGIIVAQGVLAQITRAKQVANGSLFKDEEGHVSFSGESGKIDQLMQILDQRGILDGSGDMKVIVASQFNEFLKLVEQRLQEASVGYHIITGKTSDTKRDRAMEEFQSEGGHRVFLLNAKAGGVSVTLDAADEVHCLDELWNPEDQEQLEDRAHRASRNHQVTIYHYRSEGTIDEAIAQDVEGKRQAQHEVLDGRRGQEYARKLIKYREPKD